MTYSTNATRSAASLSQSKRQLAISSSQLWTSTAEALTALPQTISQLRKVATGIDDAQQSKAFVRDSETPFNVVRTFATRGMPALQQRMSFLLQKSSSGAPNPSSASPAEYLPEPADPPLTEGLSNPEGHRFIPSQIESKSPSKAYSRVEARATDTPAGSPLIQRNSVSLKLIGSSNLNTGSSHPTNRLKATVLPVPSSEGRASVTARVRDAQDSEIKQHAGVSDSQLDLASDVVAAELSLPTELKPRKPAERGSQQLPQLSFSHPSNVRTVDDLLPAKPVINSCFGLSRLQIKAPIRTRFVEAAYSALGSPTEGIPEVQLAAPTIVEKSHDVGETTRVVSEDADSPNVRLPANRQTPRFGKQSFSQSAVPQETGPAQSISLGSTPHLANDTSFPFRLKLGSKYAEPFFAPTHMPLFASASSEPIPVEPSGSLLAALRFNDEIELGQKATLTDGNPGHGDNLFGLDEDPLSSFGI